MLKSKVRCAVFVSGGGTNLQAIIDAVGKTILHAELALVIASNHEAYALTRAQNAGIPTAVFSKKDYPSNEAKESAMLNCLQEHDIDMIALAGYLSILSADFIRRYPHRIINIHPSLIPSFCGEGMYGLRVHEAALRKGVKVSGATVHYVNEIPDGGEIIMQKAVPVEDGDTPEVLQRRIMEQAEWTLFPAAVELVAQKILAEENNAQTDR